MKPSSSCAALLSLVWMLEPGCTGTEAGNPSKVDASVCKGDDEYRPLALAIQRAARPHLEDIQRIPIWLECVEARHEEGRLALQIANFRGGCHIDWMGGARIEHGVEAPKVVVDLKNESCSVAGCGNCTYDLVVEPALDLANTPAELEVQLLRRDCRGEVDLESAYPVRLGDTGSGLFCRPADPWGVRQVSSDPPEGAEIDLYAPCGPSGSSAADDSYSGARVEVCADALVCFAGSCVATCSTDADCPLSGAERCVQTAELGGVCQLVGAE